MITRTISVAARFRQWFRWAGEFLSTRSITFSDRLRVTVEPNWSARVSKDRQSLVVTGTATAEYRMSPAEQKILAGQKVFPLADGASLRITNPLMTLAQASKVADGQLTLPEGITIEVDGYPDPVAHSVEIQDALKAVIRLVAKPLGIPVHILAEMVPDA